MKFYPTSRYISVIPNKPERQETAIEMYDDVYEGRTDYVLCKVVERGPEVNAEIKTGQTIAVEKLMLRELKVDDETFWVILDNYVVGRFV